MTDRDVGSHGATRAGWVWLLVDKVIKSLAMLPVPGVQYKYFILLKRHIIGTFLRQTLSV